MSYNDLFHEALTCFDNEDFDKAVKRAPLMAVKMVMNVFRLRGLKNKFLHTEHTITSVDKA